MKRLPNVISMLRIAGSIGLLFCDVSGWLFWTLYVLCGFSDMADGWLARKLHAETEAGAIWDCFLHTVANKLTGLLLFLTVPASFWSMIPIAIVAAMATFAAVQEGHYIRTKQVF